MHIACLIPLGVLILDAGLNRLTANPIQAAMQRTGLTALIILTIMLSLTPLSTITHELYFRSFRKPVGLYAFLYASVHMLIFVVLDFNLNGERLIRQVTEKPFILLGLTGYILLAALAITSFKSVKAKMGKNWRRLHRMVYLIAVLIVVHDTLSQKGNAFQVQGNLLQPILLGSIILLLLLLRVPVVKNLFKA